jgi:hypothetical protein
MDSIRRQIAAYLEEFPEGGLMLKATAFGSVFLRSCSPVCIPMSCGPTGWKEGAVHSGLECARRSG